MHILDETTDKSLKNIVLYLTFAEALELKDSLDKIINKPFNNHFHIPDENFQKELTVCVYNVDDLSGFNERSINLIINNQ